MNADQFQIFLDNVQQALHNHGQGNDNAKLMSYNNKPEEMTWTDFRVHFITVMQTTGWNDLRARRQLKIAMKGEAATMVNDLTVEGHNNIQAMLNAFEQRFLPAAEGNLIRAEFRAARQQPNETLLKFHTRIRTLFVRAYPNDPVANNRHLIDTFVAGLADPAIKMHTLDQTPNTFAEALIHAQTKEANLLTYKNSLDSASSVSHLEAGVHALQFTERKCYLCSENHLLKDCPQFHKVRSLAENLPGGRGQSSGWRRGGRGRGGRWRGRGSRGRGNQGQSYNSSRGVYQMQEEEGPEEECQEDQSEELDVFVQGN